MFLSIIIPVYQDAEGIKTTVSTLLDNNPELTDFEIIICIDGGLKDDIAITVEMIKSYPDNKISYYCMIPNEGSYNARNIGAKNAKGDVLAFIDAGVYVQAEWYKTLQKYILDYDYIAGSVKIPWEWAQTLFEKYDSITGFPVQEYMEKFHFGPTANIVVKRIAFENVHGFDSRLRSGGDNIFGYKVFNKKYKQVYAKEMEVLHAPRNRYEIKHKMKRIIQGLMELHEYYPDRFVQKSHNPLTIFIVNCINVFLHPSKFKTKKSKKLSWVEFVFVENVIGYYRFSIRKNIK